MDRLDGLSGRNRATKELLRILALLTASLIIALNIKSFVRTGGLFPGGVNGLTLLIQRAAQRYMNVSIPFTAVNTALNAIPIYIGFRYIGKKFTAYSCLVIAVTNILTDLIPGFAVTSDPLLISVFGGLINAVAMSVCLKAGATTGGTDFIGIFLSERSGRDSFNVILGINACILTAAGFMFGWDKALYSIIFQFVSTQVLHVTYRNYQQETLLIVTEHPDEICAAISDRAGHGATVLHGEGAYGGEPRCLVYSVIARSDHAAVIHSVRVIDPKAFTNVMPTDELLGRFYSRPHD